MIRYICIFAIAASLGACQDQASHEHHSTEDSTKKSAAVIPVGIRPTDSSVTDTVRKSIPAIATGNINGHRLVIRYHSPAVRGRIIWGGLVAFDQVWVTGAHSATSFESKTGFRMGGKEIPAGKYAFFTIPGKENWTVILNKNWEQHLADEYSDSADVVRLTIKPAAATHQERLMYTIDQTGERKCVIEMRWEKVRLRVPLELSN